MAVVRTMAQVFFLQIFLSFILIDASFYFSGTLGAARGQERGLLSEPADVPLPYQDASNPWGLL
jgi:hypothetical protein